MIKGLEPNTYIILTNENPKPINVFNENESLNPSYSIKTLFEKFPELGNFIERKNLDKYLEYFDFNT